MELLRYSLFDSAIGPLEAVMSERGLLRLEFHPKGRMYCERTTRAQWVEDRDSSGAVREQLAEYFARRRRSFDVPLDLRGTDFQLKCWRELERIPFCETRSYAQIANAIEQPRAFRAVGLANHSNPVVIIVPCHRVLAADGTLCGYGGGLQIKQALLELEGARAPELGLTPS